MKPKPLVWSKNFTLPVTLVENMALDITALVVVLRKDLANIFDGLIWIKQRGIPTSTAFTNIVLLRKCGLVLLRHKIDELEVRHKRDYDVLYQLLQRVQKTKVTKVVLSKPKIRPVSHPR